MATDVEKKDITSFKFEANVSVFGTNVDLKPMEGDEIGYRAPAGEEGINISRARIIESGLLDSNSPATKFLPMNTYVKALIYNRKTKGVELAVKAEFSKYGKMTDTEINDAVGSKTGNDLTLALQGEAKKRGILLNKIDPGGYDGASLDDAELKAALKDAPEPFILNKYPKMFAVNSVSIYVSPPPPAAAELPAGE